MSFQAEHPQPLLDESRRWSARHEAPYRGTHEPHPNDATPSRRLRIGYVSPDFRDHCQTLFTVPLLSHHDHEQFEVFCYASVTRPDDLTQRVAAHADVWRDVRALDDERLAQMIRDDRIDILIDLTMHMADGRPLLFARKPAPVQIAWLAYPGTTGIDAIDYRFDRPWLDPVGSDAWYSEVSIRLPDSFWCYDALTDTPEVNALPALSNGYPTFGCLNNPCKLSDATFRLWGDVMREVADARLLLMAPAARPVRFCSSGRDTMESPRSGSPLRRSGRARTICARITRSTSGSTRFRITAIRRASTRTGWGCRSSRGSAARQWGAPD